MRDLHAHISGSLGGKDIANIVYLNKLYVSGREEINAITEPFGIALADAIADGHAAAADAFDKLYTCRPNGTNRFEEAMARFSITSYLARQPGGKAQIAAAACRAFREDGVSYAEWRVNPFSSTKHGTAEEAYSKLSEYLEGMKDSGMDSRFVLSMHRERYVDGGKPDGERIEYMNRELERLLDTDLPIVGVDVSGPEAVPIEWFSDTFALAKKRGLGVVPHVGELNAPMEQNIADILHALEAGADRLGHAMAAYVPLRIMQGKHDGNGVLYGSGRLERLAEMQKEVLAAIKEKGTPIEVCPSSNLSAHLGLMEYRDHPVGRLVQEGIPIVVCSDDSGIFGNTVPREMAELVNAHGIDMETLRGNADRYALVRPSKA